MAVKRVDHRGSFKATGTSGKTYTIGVFVDVIDCGNSQDPNAVIDGMRSLKTANGWHVNWIDKGKYQIVQTGEELISNDPAAP